MDSMECEIVISCAMHECGETITFFGIRAKCCKECFCFPDLSTDRQRVEELAAALSHSGADPKTFLEIIEDFIG